MRKIQNLLLLICVIITVVVTILYFKLFDINIPFLSDLNIQKEKIHTANEIYSRIASFSMGAVENSAYYIIDVKKQIQAKEKINNKKLDFLLNNYQKKIVLYKKYMNNMSVAERHNIESELEKLKDIYNSVRTSFDAELKEFQFTRLNEVKLKIQLFLEGYNKTNHYDYILNDDANFIYYKNSKNDITQNIIDGLNNQYLIENNIKK